MDPITPRKNKRKNRKFIELPLQQTNKYLGKLLLL